MKKKTYLVILALCAAMAMTACGTSAGQKEETKSTAESQDTADEKDSKAADSAESDSDKESTGIVSGDTRLVSVDDVSKYVTIGRITPRTTKISRRIAATTQVIRFIILRRLNCCCFLRILSRKTLLSILYIPIYITYNFLMSKLYHTSFGIQIQWNFRKNLLIFASSISVSQDHPLSGWLALSL